MMLAALSGPKFGSSEPKEHRWAWWLLCNPSTQEGDAKIPRASRLAKLA